MIYLFIAGTFAFRLAMLALSVRHERALLQLGAVEYGRGTSRAIALAHTTFYIAAATEGVIREASFDWVSGVGLCVYLLAAAMLVSVVRLLGPLWTVKLILAPDHRLVRHPLFRAVRHPNYFLNILPELVGYALTLHALLTLLIGIPIYLVPLVRRIRDEEAVMRARFADYP